MWAIVEENMNKILYQGKHVTVKIREVIIAIIIIIILLLVLCKCSAKKADELNLKLSAIERIEEFPKRNVNDIIELLNSADLCSERWYKDVDDYISRLEEQNELLKDKSSSEYKEVYEVQVKLLEKVKSFREKQDEKTIKELEEVVNEYKEMGEE